MLELWGGCCGGGELLRKQDGEIAVDPTGYGGVAIGEGDLNPIARTSRFGGIFFSGDGGEDRAVGVGEATDINNTINVGWGD